MFKPSTKRIEKLSKIFPDVVEELENIFDSDTNVYIDWQNVIHWQDRLKFHIHLGRLKQFFDSFTNIKIVKLYTGTLVGNEKSEKSIREFEKLGYKIKTKPVKLMKMSINTSSIPKNSPVLLDNFIKKCLLSKLNLNTIEFLNERLSDFNKQGITFIEDKKCNFDVEIGRDMLRDFDNDNLGNFILWSGDSDFVDPINQLVIDNKKVFLFATAREVSCELNEIKVPIFDIKKIKEFICWPKELSQSIKDKVNDNGV
ncbi:MAG: NYN domain-containing protein [Candidatus Paceibacterota bacterium]